MIFYSLLSYFVVFPKYNSFDNSLLDNVNRTTMAILRVVATRRQISSVEFGPCVIFDAVADFGLQLVVDVDVVI